MAAKIKMTRTLAYAVGQDAGNKSMNKAGRTAWNHTDYNAASRAFAKALALVH